MLRLVFFNFLLQRIDSARVSTASLIDLFAYPSHVQQYCHPNVSNNNINGYHGRENFTTHFVHFFHSSLVCTTTNPTTGYCGHAAPDRFRTSAIQHFRRSEERRVGKE